MHGHLNVKFITMHGHLNVQFITMHGHLNVKFITMHGHLNVQFITMHGHLNVKYVSFFRVSSSTITKRKKKCNVTKIELRLKANMTWRQLND